MKGNGSGVFRLICILFSAAALVMTLLGSVKAASLSRDIKELEAKIELAEDENLRLRLIKGSAPSLEELERYATEVLGMQTPAAGQINYIDYQG